MLPLLIALTGGCTTETETRDPVLSGADSSEAVRVELTTAVGIGTVEVWVRLVNSWGAAVPGDKVRLKVKGDSAELVDDQVELDSSGYGVAYVQVDAPEVFEVSVQTPPTGVEGGDPVLGYAVGASLPLFELNISGALPAGIDEISHVSRAPEGMAMVSGSDVWWQSTDLSVPAHRVLAMDDDILGMWSFHVDADGIEDLVVWTAQYVVALRGRGEGGYGWGGSWSSETHEITGVSVADLDGDRLGDLAISMVGGDEGAVELLSGDGVWGFDPLVELSLPYPIESVTALDEGNDGRPDVTVLSGDNGFLFRYTAIEEGWIGAQPFELDAYTAPIGSHLLPQADLNGDGGTDLVLVAAADATSQELVFYTVGSSVTKYEQRYETFWVDMADVDKNGTVDILAIEEDGLHLIRYDLEKERFISQSVNGTGEPGPLAASDVDGDGIHDL
ncbi:MAG: FG-GAP-like repeat-containing protein, partial [Myxococcota bacterium]|nr:FG-GAP-like repeat-containing protein [Myxococcota bacterium]